MRFYDMRTNDVDREVLQSPGTAAGPRSEGALHYSRLVEDKIVPRLERSSVEIVLATAAEPRGFESAGSAAAMNVLSCHTHEEYELCWVIEGRCVLRVNQQTILLDNSRACLVRPGEVHQLLPTAALDHFHTMWWRPVARAVSLHESVFAGRRRVGRASLAGVDDLTKLALDRVVREIEFQRPHHRLLVRVSLLDLAGRILRALAEVNTEGGMRVDNSCAQANSWPVQYVMDYVHSHHGADVTLKHLAGIVGLSPNYLTTLFRHATGRTAMAYVNDVRHLEALSLLRNTAVPIANVAQLVGCEDVYYFSRRFKDREGCSPQQYRRLFRG